MFNNVKSFFEEIVGKKIYFIGIGISHYDLIKIMKKNGAIVTLCDKRQSFKEYDELSSLGINMELGEKYLDNLENADIVFRSPGVMYSLPQLTNARKKGVVVTSELEVFFLICPCPIFAVTGSDGKTTSTTIISEMLSAEGFTVHKGGNIGKPLLSVVRDITPNDFAVVELSSFQLMSMQNAPFTSLITNITPNHLDMHRDMQEYIKAKKNIFIHQSAFSRTVLNADNELTSSFIDEVRGECMTFSVKKSVELGAYLAEDGYLYMAHNEGTTKLFHKDDIRIPGIHNVENYLGTICAVWNHVGIQTIKNVAKEFAGVEHRIEFVRTVEDVKYYNDSIASSPTRTIAGLNSFNQKPILIAGGYDKKLPFLPLAPKVIEKVKLLILMGDTAEKIRDTIVSFTGYNQSELDIVIVDNMYEAVHLAHSSAKANDIVYLSPACASFDKYVNFEARGLDFKNIVNAL